MIFKDKNRYLRSLRKFNRTCGRLWHVHRFSELRCTPPEHLVCAYPLNNSWKLWMSFTGAVLLGKYIVATVRLKFLPLFLRAPMWLRSIRWCKSGAVWDWCRGTERSEKWLCKSTRSCGLLAFWKMLCACMLCRLNVISFGDADLRSMATIMLFWRRQRQPFWLASFWRNYWNANWCIAVIVFVNWDANRRKKSDSSNMIFL